MYRYSFTPSLLPYTHAQDQALQIVHHGMRFFLYRTRKRPLNPTALLYSNQKLLAERGSEPQILDKTAILKIHFFIFQNPDEEIAWKGFYSFCLFLLTCTLKIDLVWKILRVFILFLSFFFFFFPSFFKGKLEVGRLMEHPKNKAAPRSGS